MTVAERILSLLDYQGLKSAEQVSPDWHQVVVSGNLYRNLYQRNVSIHTLYLIYIPCLLIFCSMITWYYKKVGKNGIWKDFTMMRQKEVSLVQEQEDEHLLYKTYCEKLHQTVEVCLANAFPCCCFLSFKTKQFFFFIYDRICI